MASEYAERLEAIRAFTRFYEQDAIRQHYENCRERLVPFLQSLRNVREGYWLLRHMDVQSPDVEPADLESFVARPVSAWPEIGELLHRVRRGDEAALHALHSALSGPHPVWAMLVEVGSGFEDLLLATAQVDTQALISVAARLSEMDEQLASMGQSPEVALAAAEYKLARLHLELVRVFARKHRRGVLKDYWQQQREEAQRNFNRAAKELDRA